VDKGSGAARERKWHDSGHASLCLLGSYLRRVGFFRPWEEGLRLKQKVVKDSPVQKLEMVVVSLLTGAKAIAHSDLTLRVDPALQAAFGLPGCAEQSVLAETLDAATDEDVADLRQVVEEAFRRYSQARRHRWSRGVLTLDLSPLPARGLAEGSERCYMGRCRSKTGRKLVRVRAAPYQETVWEQVLPGRTVETLAVVQQAVAAAELLLDLADSTWRTRPGGREPGGRTPARPNRVAARQRLGQPGDHQLALGAGLSSHRQVQIHLPSQEAGGADHRLGADRQPRSGGCPDPQAGRVGAPVCPVRGANALQREGRWLFLRRALQQPAGVGDGGHGGALR
jgi:hypothetical protein